MHSNIPTDAALAVHFSLTDAEVAEIRAAVNIPNTWGEISPEQLASLDSLVAALRDKAERCKSLVASLKAAYSDFSDGGKWAFGNAYDTVVNHIRRGDIAAAKLTVQMIIIPAEVPDTTAEQLATWTAKKTEILALFP